MVLSAINRKPDGALSGEVPDELANRISDGIPAWQFVERGGLRLNWPIPHTPWGIGFYAKECRPAGRISQGGIPFASVCLSLVDVQM